MLKYDELIEIEKRRERETGIKQVIKISDFIEIKYRGGLNKVGPPKNSTIFIKESKDGKE